MILNETLCLKFLYNILKCSLYMKNLEFLHVSVTTVFKINSIPLEFSTYKFQWFLYTEKKTILMRVFKIFSVPIEKTM